MVPLLGIEPHSTLSNSTSNTALSTGCANVRLPILPFLSNEPINNITVRTKPFSSGNVSIIFAIFHSFCPQLSFFKMTLSFCWKFLLVDDHFCLSCNDNKNSLRHRLQNSLIKCCTLLHSLLPKGSIITFDFIVKRLAGENVTLLFTSLMISATTGLEFTIALISVKNVFSNSSSKLVLCAFRTDESIAWVDLICHSHTPPI